jgi:hypothetical protein
LRKYIFRSFSRTSEYEKALPIGHSLKEPSSQSLLETSIIQLPDSLTNTMATFSLDNQFFYTGPVSASQISKSRGILAPSRNGDLSAAVPGAPSRKATPHTAPLQHISDLRRNGPGNSPDNTVLIINGESDYDASNVFDDGQSDATFPPLKELLPAPRNAARPNGVASTDMCLTFLAPVVDHYINAPEQIRMPTPLPVLVAITTGRRLWSPVEPRTMNLY